MTEVAKPTKPLINAIFYRDWEASHIPEILEEVWLKAIYLPYLTGKQDMIIGDWGANIGLFSHYVQRFAKKIYAIEPSKAHLEILKKNIEFNNIKNVEILPYALSNKAGKRKFYLNPNNTAHSLSLITPEYEEVECITIDDLLKITGVEKFDLIKADVEGEESKVFTSDSFIQNKDKFPVIIGEWHAWTEMNIQQFQYHFEELGYHFRLIYGLKATVFVATL